MEYQFDEQVQVDVRIHVQDKMLHFDMEVYT
jgi:hypothetical protein